MEIHRSQFFCWSGILLLKLEFFICGLLVDDWLIETPDPITFALCLRQKHTDDQTSNIIIKRNHRFINTLKHFTLLILISSNWRLTLWSHPQAETSSLQLWIVQLYKERERDQMGCMYPSVFTTAHTSSSLFPQSPSPLQYLYSSGHRTALFIPHLLPLSHHV